MKRPSQSVGSFHFPHHRILITGANGAGKSWFAERLAERLGLRWISNDALSLGHNWTYLQPDQIAQAQQHAIAQDHWVLDGGASLVRPDVLARAQVVVWLDPPAGLRFRRIIWRSLKYFGRTRPEHPDGNVEWPGARQVRFAYKAWAKDARVRASIHEGLARVDIPVIRLRTPEEVRQLLQS